MNERTLRELLESYVAKYGKRGSRIPVLQRRRILYLAEKYNLDVWVCEVCGETEEEELCIVDMPRVTRQRGGAAVIVCAGCEGRVCHGGVLTD